MSKTHRIMITRRTLLAAGAGALVAAPAIVRAGSLMRVRVTWWDAAADEIVRDVYAMMEQLIRQSVLAPAEVVLALPIEIALPVVRKIDIVV